MRKLCVEDILDLTAYEKQRKDFRPKIIAVKNQRRIHVGQKATYLFGDIAPNESIEDLIAFARQYADLDDGWCSSTLRPLGLSGKTLARVPAFIFATVLDEGPLH